MDKESYLKIIERHVHDKITEFLPNGAGTMTEQRLRKAIEDVAAYAFSEGQNYALTNLMTTEQVADKLGVSLRRVQAIAQDKHARFGVGMQIQGKNPWLFRPEEVDILRPGPGGRPRKTPIAPSTTKTQ